MKVALPEVHRRLAGLASRKRITVPKQESLAKAMAAYPDRDFVAVADELVFWAEDGHGSQRKIKVLAGTYRNFLKHSSPDPMAVARELDALDGAIDSTAVEL